MFFPFPQLSAAVVKYLLMSVLNGVVHTTFLLLGSFYRYKVNWSFWNTFETILGFLRVLGDGSGSKLKATYRSLALVSPC